MDPHLKLGRWWAETGAGIVTRSAKAGAVEMLSQRYDLVLPDLFRRYLVSGSPMAEYWDDEMGNWWPVARVRNIPDEHDGAMPSFLPNGGRKFLFFLDHCIWCWAWAISCEQDATFGRIVLIGGQEERFVAESFAEFVDRYIEDWLSVN